MNVSDFAFWMAGYVGDSEKPPTQEQWNRIQSNLARVTGATRFNDQLPNFKKRDPNQHPCLDVNPQKSESFSTYQGDKNDNRRS